MKPFKKRQPNDPVDYWDSLADVMVALFLCILLIMLLFVLYFIETDALESHVDDTPGAGVPVVVDPGTQADQSTEGERSDESEDEEEGREHTDSNSDANNGGGNEGRHEEEERRRSINSFERDGEDEEEGEKSAVLVKVVDGETLLPLARDSIEFELYDGNSRLLSLNDYYPDKVEHATFKTNKNGQFYLPEKIRKGDYMLRALNEIDGYDMAEDTYYTVEDYYDWDKPLEVVIRMYPLRSTVHIQLVDAKSGEGVTGGSFQVIAADNIKTLDGSIRFRTGDVVDTVLLDGNGEGTSRELYYGKYLLREEMVPDYYGLLSEDVRVEIKEKTAVSKTVKTEKTAQVLKVIDALYDDITIPGAEFVVSGGVKTGETYVSDSLGQIVLTDLQKDTTYTIVQTTAAPDYRMDTTEYSFQVDGSGLIQGKVRSEMTIQNRMIRASFQVVGTLLGNQMSDIRMTLVDRSGKVVQQWTTSGKDALITGLEPDTYKLMIGSDLDHPIEIYIADEVNVQNFQYTRWTLLDTGLVLLGVFVALVLGVILSALYRRMQNNKGAKGPKGGVKKK